MSKKKWALLVSCILLLVGWFKLFYKTYSETTVTTSADCIVAVDVKRIANTIIWNIITTPSQWKFSTSTDKEEGKVSLNDMVKLPDFVFVFHTASQPVNAWYTLLEVKDKDDFSKGLQQYHFETKDGLSSSKELGIEFIQCGDKLLVGNLAVENKTYIRQAGEELFAKKQYSTKDILGKNVDAASHVAVQIAKNDFWQDEYLVTANFDKERITVTAGLPWKSKANFVENNFQYNDSSLCTLAFSQPYSQYTDLNSLLPGSARAGISKALNFNIDSMLLPTNLHYQLDIEGIHSRVDSAISYTYDDNFNPVEKIVVNAVEEPAFNFTVQGVDVNPVFNYWKNSGKLEQTAAGDLFTPIPFVKSYCSKKNEQQLVITSNNYKAPTANHSVQSILFFKLLLTKIPPSLTKYLPDGLMNAIKNMESVEIRIDNEKGGIMLRANLRKKKNDLPIIEW